MIALHYCYAVRPIEFAFINWFVLFLIQNKLNFNKFLSTCKHIYKYLIPHSFYSVYFNL